MNTVQITNQPTTVVTDDGKSVVILNATNDTRVVLVDASGNPGPFIDMHAAQDGDVLHVSGANLVPTHQQTNQLYDGGNF